MRGKGITRKIKYRWTKQPNGRYTIFDVPIFSTFNDEEKGSLDPKELDEIVQNFEDRYRNEGYYPRIHIKHQDEKGVENAPGAGYLDNLRVQGNVIYADLAEIKPKYFAAIRAEDLPGRSPEYLPAEKEIRSLALLESRAPFFRFPMLTLRPKPERVDAEMVSFFDNRQQILFQKGGEMGLFAKKFQADPDEPITDGKEDNDEMEKMCADCPGGKMKNQGKDEPQQFEEDGGGMEEKMDNLLSMMQKLVGFIDSDDDGEIEDEAPVSEEEDMEDMDEADDEPEDDDTVSSNDPEPVAMQAGTKAVLAELKKIRNFQAKQDREIMTLKAGRQEDTHLTRLKEICESSPAINFSATAERLKKFATDEDRKNFLDYVETDNQGHSRHPLTAMRMNEADDLTKKFADKPRNVQMVAKKATKDYYDTCNQRSERKAKLFQRMYPTVGDYVEDIARLEEEMPGSYGEN